MKIRFTEMDREDDREEMKDPACENEAEDTNI
jgi:hypothetical protein